MFNRWIVVLSVLLVGFVIGCGEKPKVVKPETTTPTADDQLITGGVEEGGQAAHPKP